MIELADVGLSMDPSFEIPGARPGHFADALRVYAASPAAFWNADGRFDFAGLAAVIADELALEPSEASFLMMRVISFHNLFRVDRELETVCADMADPDALSEFAIETAAGLPFKPWTTVNALPTINPGEFRAALRRRMN